jgi:hypothetical protein
MAIAAQKIVTTKTKDLELKYQIKFAQAISKMKHKIVCLILHAHSEIKLLIEQTLRNASKTIEAVRDGRSVPQRLKNINNDIYFSA